jgi:hypothetical protein
MAAPNIVNVVTITVMANVVTNLTNSNTVVKINDVMVSNYASGNMTANVIINRGGTNYYIGANVLIPGFSTLVLIGKDSFVYLEENDYLQANASANTSMHCISAYEIIS